MAGASVVVAILAALVALPAGWVAWSSVPALLAAYWCGVALSRRAAGLVVALTAVGFVAAAPLVATRWWAGLAPMVLAALLVGAALGHAVRSRRELATARRDRDLHEQRLALARDVHDLVGHHLAVVNVHAGVATHMLPARPEAAATALGHVSRASSAALDELGALLGALREPGPGLDRLDGLLGPDDVLTVRGGARPLSAAVDTTAYRIVQEALTNARRHGRGPARLTVAHEPDGLVLECRNDLGTDRPDRTGHGLAGMRERVAGAGGQLAAGRDGAEFVVRVMLPVRGAG